VTYHLRWTIGLLIIAFVVFHVECHSTLPASEATFVPWLQQTTKQKDNYNYKQIKQVAGHWCYKKMFHCSTLSSVCIRIMWDGNETSKDRGIDCASGPPLSCCSSNHQYPAVTNKNSLLLLLEKYCTNFNMKKTPTLVWSSRNDGWFLEQVHMINVNNLCREMTSSSSSR